LNDGSNIRALIYSNSSPNASSSSASIGKTSRQLGSPLDRTIRLEKGPKSGLKLLEIDHFSRLELALSRGALLLWPSLELVSAAGQKCCKVGAPSTSFCVAAGRIRRRGMASGESWSLLAGWQQCRLLQISAALRVRNESPSSGRWRAPVVGNLEPPRKAGQPAAWLCDVM